MKIYFLPDTTGTAEKNFFDIVEKARCSIQVCVYSFTSKDLADLLIKKASS